MTVRIDHSLILDRPVDDVWEYMDDLENYPMWAAGLSEVRQLTPGPKGVGTRIAWVYQFLGHRFETTLEVTAFEPNRKFAGHMSAGPLQLQATWHYESIGDKTMLTTLIEGETGGLFKLTDPLVTRAMERQMVASYGTLKDLLEARVPA